MNRLPQEAIERIKQNVPIEELCRRRGIELKTQGSKNRVALSPFTDEKTPSFVVTPGKNLWNCFSAQKGGSVIDLVMKLDGLSFLEAAQKLNEEFPQAAQSALPPPKPSAPAKKTLPPEQLRQLTGKILDHYQQTLLEDEHALDYLKKRKIYCPEAIKTFQLGYAKNYQLAPALGIEGKKTRDCPQRQALQQLGIIRSSGHEHMAGRIVFPVFDSQQNLSEIYGRFIDKCRPEARHLYLPGVHRGVWNARELRQHDTWILCESAIDALSFWVHGIKNVTWTYGCKGFTEDHAALIREVKPTRILNAFDADENGIKSANALCTRLQPLGVSTWRVQLPQEKDINALVCESDDPPATLAELIANAEPMFQVENKPPEPPVVLKPPENTQPTLQVQGVNGTTEAIYQIGPRQYRIHGLDANNSLDRMKITLRLRINEPRKAFHLDNLDLYSARQRAAFVATAKDITELPTQAIEDDLANLIEELERHQQQRLKEKHEPPTESTANIPPEREIKALALLRDPKIFDRITADFTRCGYVGEERNLRLGYVLGISRMLDAPVSVLIMSRSAAGKSALMNAILSLVPEEHKKEFSSMTDQALFYLQEDALKHKILSFAEDEGGQNVAYPLKILQSEKVITLAVTVKDPNGGLSNTVEKRVNGPVSHFSCSTQAEVDYEQYNRYVILTVDESAEQTQRIQKAQRNAYSIAGMLQNAEKKQLQQIHHDAQRLLRPLQVAIPDELQLNFPSDRLRLRRDYPKYLGTLRSIAFLRQFQKKTHTLANTGVQYICADETDLQLTNELLLPVLERTVDELTPPTRKFLEALDQLVSQIETEQQIKRTSIRLTRRQIRENLQWSTTQVREHLDRLLEMEYVICHRKCGSAARFEYELAYQPGPGLFTHL